MTQKILAISDYSNLISPRPEAELFVTLFQRGWDITLMVPKNSPWIPRFQEVGIPLIFFKAEVKYNKTEVAFIRNVLNELNPDLLILFNNKAVVNGIQAAKKHPVKVVVYRGTVGNVYWYDPTSYLKVLHPRVDYVLCLHEPVKEHLDKQFFNTRKTVVIHKGHKKEWYEGVVPKTRKELGLPENAFCVAYVGNVRRFKGMPYLLKATKYLSEAKNLHLLLIGSGFDEKKYVKMIAESPMKDRIHVFGYRTDALEIVATSDVLALPSLRTESLTKAVQEAMHLGVCPVITDIAGNQGLVHDGVSGRVVPIKDSKAMGEAIMDCYLNPEKTSVMGREAQNHIRQWLTHERTVEDTENAFRYMLNG